MIKLDIQLFGGRGSSSSNASSGTRTGLKGYFSKAREKLKDVAFKNGKEDIITDSFSMFMLNKTGLPYSKDEKLTNSVKGLRKKVEGFEKQINNYQDINTFMSSMAKKDTFGGTEIYDINDNYGVAAKYIKKAKTILGKDARVGIAYEEVGFGSNAHQQPHIIVKNKKGETAWILPVRKY